MPCSRRSTPSTPCPDPSGAHNGRAGPAGPARSAFPYHRPASCVGSSRCSPWRPARWPLLACDDGAATPPTDRARWRSAASSRRRRRPRLVDRRPSRPTRPSRPSRPIRPTRRTPSGRPRRRRRRPGWPTTSPTSSPARRPPRRRATPSSTTPAGCGIEVPDGVVRPPHRAVPARRRGRSAVAGRGARPDEVPRRLRRAGPDRGRRRCRGQRPPSTPTPSPTATTAAATPFRTARVIGAVRGVAGVRRHGDVDRHRRGAPDRGDETVLLLAQVLAPSDLAALDQALATLQLRPA